MVLPCSFHKSFWQLIIIINIITKDLKKHRCKIIQKLRQGLQNDAIVVALVIFVATFAIFCSFAKTAPVQKIG